MIQNEQLCQVGGGGGGGGRLKSFTHLWPLVTSDQFVLQTVTRGYRIAFTGNPPRTTKARCTPIPCNQARRRDLELMLENRNKRSGISPSQQTFRDMGSLYRFKRCLSSHSHGTRTHEVPALCLRQQGVHVPSAPVWILDGTQGVHENSESDLSVPQDTGCRHALVSRRLALKKPVKVASRTPT